MSDSMSSNHYEDTDFTILLKGTTPTVDIVAVENIGETSLKSWTHEKEGRNIVWLQDKEFLQQRVPTSARVFNFSYRIQNESTLNSLAGDLLRKIGEARNDNEKDRPIVFIGLGFGGMLCMKVLFAAKELPIYNVFHAVALISVLYAKGRGMVTAFAEVASELLPNSLEAQESLKYMSGEMQSAWIDFMEISSDFEIVISKSPGHPNPILDQLEKCSPEDRRRIRPINHAYRNTLGFAVPTDSLFTMLSKEIVKSVQAAARAQGKRERRLVGTSAPLVLLMRPDKRKWAEYNYLKPPESLGNGVQKVNLCQFNVNKLGFACRFWAVLGGTPETRAEIEVLKILDRGHQHIVYHRDFWNGEYYSYIVMELCKGNLADLQVNSGTSLPKRLLLEIFLQISDGLDYLHNVAQVCHRDLKPENDGPALVCKIADFGISCPVTGAQMNRTRQARGTSEYIAPEIRKQSFHVPADIWALGCMMLYFTIGELEMSEWTLFVRDEVERNKDDPSSELPNLFEALTLPEEPYDCFNDIIKKTFNLNPEERPKARELWNFPVSVVLNQESLHRASGVDASTVSAFLRYCLERDFSNRHYIHHDNGIAVLFEENHEINQLRGGWTAMGYAAYNGNAELVEILLEAGANINARESDNATALHDACISGNPEVFKVLLDHSPDVNLQDNNGETPLKLAVGSSSNLDIAKILLKANAKVDIVAKDGATALHAAMMEGTAEILELLLKQKPDVNILDSSGWLPIHRLVTRASLDRNEMVKMVTMLFTAGASLTARYGFGSTLLHGAASIGNIQLMKMLIEKTGWIDPEDGESRTPLTEAVVKNQVAVVKLLLKEGANYRNLDVDLNSPIHEASRYGHLEIVNILLDQGDRKELSLARNKEGWTPLQVAILNGPHLEVVKRFVEIGGDVKTPSADYLDGLQLASRFDIPELVQLFLDADGDVHEKGGLYGSALQVAARYGSLGVVKLLLEHGAVDAEEGWFGNAMNAASSYGHSDVVAILREHTISLPIDSTTPTEDEDIVMQGVDQFPGYLRHTEYGSVLAAASISDGVDTEMARPRILPARMTDYEPTSCLKVYEEGLEVEYTSSGGNGEYHAASIRSDSPIPPSTQIYYYEVKVLNRGNRGFIGIGLRASWAALSGQPGWTAGSWGYHGDDARLYHVKPRRNAFGPQFTTNDVIGCGLDFQRRLIFYTKNGNLLDVAFRNLGFQLPEPCEDDIYPTIGLQSDGERVRINFGKEPFVFNIGKYVKSVLGSAKASNNSTTI